MVTFFTKIALSKIQVRTNQQHLLCVSASVIIFSKYKVYGRCSLLQHMCKMATIIQAINRSDKYPLEGFSRTPALQKRPQVKGVITRVTTMSPKKPNSASRHIAKVKLTNDINITARVPGIGYMCAKYNRVLVNGGRANDLPGVGYSLIRGVFDFSPVLFKHKRRSVYGTRRPDNFTKHIRRSLRKTK